MSWGLAMLSVCSRKEAGAGGISGMKEDDGVNVTVGAADNVTLVLHVGNGSDSAAGTTSGRRLGSANIWEGSIYTCSIKDLECSFAKINKGLTLSSGANWL